MATVSGRMLRIASQRLGSDSADRLLRAVETADEVVFDFDRSFRADALKIVTIVCALSRRPRQVAIRFADETISPGLRDALGRNLFAALLSPSRLDAAGKTLSSDEIASRTTPYVDAERKLFCVSTADLSSKTRESFHSDLGKWMVAARIAIDPSVSERIAMLAYEANANAEEHGSIRLTEAKSFDDSPVFRCFAVILHDSSEATLPPAASEYVEQYERHHSWRTRWLEIIVADAGMGLTYPAFLLRAKALSSTCTDVYEANVLAERAQFEEVLTKGMSTKGFWGHQQSASGAVGQGIGLIKRNIARLRGCAVVRAGRCQAAVSYTETAFDEAKVRSTGYALDATEHPVLRGTIWHMLVPLDQQLQISL